jgi:hypothetical protein
VCKRLDSSTCNIPLSGSSSAHWLRCCHCSVPSLHVLCRPLSSCCMAVLGLNKPTTSLSLYGSSPSSHLQIAISRLLMEISPACLIFPHTHCLLLSPHLSYLVLHPVLALPAMLVAPTRSLCVSVNSLSFTLNSQCDPGPADSAP